MTVTLLLHPQILLTGGHDEIEALAMGLTKAAEKGERGEMLTRAVVFMCEHERRDGLRHTFDITQHADG